jgi:hypothetical protein
MNPSSNESLNLPPPVSNEQLTPPEVGKEAPANSPEVAASGAEKNVGRAQPAAAVPPIPSVPVPPVLSMPAGQTAVPSTTNNVVPAAADDSDLIEKEWVNKAKQIVERTRDDPRRQSEELTVVKADYLQKRYNKTIKLSK